MYHVPRRKELSNGVYNFFHKYILENEVSCVRTGEFIRLTKIRFRLLYVFKVVCEIILLVLKSAIFRKFVQVGIIKE